MTPKSSPAEGTAFQNTVPSGRLHRPSLILDRIACFGGRAFDIFGRPVQSLWSLETAPSYDGEHEEVEKVHATEDEQDKADLGTPEFDGPLDIVRLIAVLEREGHISHVDKIESDK